MPIQLSQLVLNPPLNIQVVENEEQLEELCSFLDSQKIVGLDIETTPTKDFWWRRCRTIQFGNVDHQFVIDLLSFCDGDSQLLFDCQGEYGKRLELAPRLKKLIEKLKPYICEGKLLLCGTNLGFEYMTFYWNFGLRTWNFYDCMLAEKCIYAGYHSLKDYSFFSLEEMMGRYFHVDIDKSLQESFTLDGILTQAQYEYAALDTRLPLAIKAAQELIITGQTIKSRKMKGLGTVILERIDPIVTGDNLEEVVQIENDAIGAFVDMHLHGEYIDHDKWMKRIETRKIELKDVIIKLDEVFIPLVGKKEAPVPQEAVDAARADWEKYKKVTDEELALKGQARKDKKAEREKQRDYYKQIYQELKSKATKKNLKEFESCEGNALINYGSSTQLLKVLVTIKGLKNLKDTNDDTLEQFNNITIIKLIQDYREISTYGEAWVTCWVEKPCKEQGWVHPGDKKIHHVYNQNEAETGRSSSEKPNGQNIPPPFRECYIVDPPDEKEPDGYSMVICDAAGCELRIIAELSGDPIWINAFKNDEDVHSVGTEILYPEEWPKVKCLGGEKIIKNGKEKILPPCAYYKLKPDDIYPQRHKCECPQHELLRKNNKSANFLLAYGGGPNKLAKEIKQSFTVAKELMAKHERSFPRIWDYLTKSGQSSRINGRSFDMFGRRRLFPQPTWERAKELAREKRKERLEFSIEVQKKNMETFVALHKRKPNKEELWYLQHREVSSQEIGNAMQAMGWGIERQGKNHAIQGSNASLAKIALASLWHILPNYNARLTGFVHDEIKIQCPKRFSEQVAKEVVEAFRKSVLPKMKSVEMKADFKISDHWEK